MKHTPGPWLLAEDGSPFVYALNERGTNRFYLGVSSGWVNDEHATTEEMMANAHLIAAAPDLAEALDRILAAEAATQYGVNNDNRDERYRELAKALISARGVLKKARNES